MQKRTGCAGSVQGQTLHTAQDPKLPNIDELIYHIITLEFPKKYKPFNIADPEKVRKQIQIGKQSSRDELKTTIKKCHEKFIQW